MAEADWVPPVLDPLTTHREQTWWVDLLDDNDVPLGKLDFVTDVSLDDVLGGVIPGGGTVSLKVRELPFNQLTARLQPWIKVAGLDPWPLGIYVVNAPNEDVQENTTNFSLELLDKLAVLDGDKVDAAYSVAAGAVVTDVVGSLILSAGETSIAITASPETLVAGAVWPTGTTKLRIINDLLAMINYFSLKCDAYGRYTAAPYASPADREIARRFLPGETSIHLPAYSRSQDLSSIPNKVVLTSMATWNVEALTAVATNTDPASQYSYPSRGNRWIVYSEDMVEATSQAVLNGLAARKLEALSRASATVLLEHAAVPLPLNSVVQFESRRGTTLAVVQKTRTRLAKGQPVGLVRTTIREVEG